jgi:hypothetical protein
MNIEHKIMKYKSKLSYYMKLKMRMNGGNNEEFNIGDLVEVKDNSNGTLQGTVSHILFDGSVIVLVKHIKRNSPIGSSRLIEEKLHLEPSELINLTKQKQNQNQDIQKFSTNALPTHKVKTFQKTFDEGTSLEDMVKEVYKEFKNDKEYTFYYRKEKINVALPIDKKTKLAGNIEITIIGDDTVYIRNIQQE